MKHQRGIISQLTATRRVRMPAVLAGFLLASSAPFVASWIDSIWMGSGSLGEEAFGLCLLTFLGIWLSGAILVAGVSAAWRRRRCPGTDAPGKSRLACHHSQSPGCGPPLLHG